MSNTYIYIYIYIYRYHAVAKGFPTICSLILKDKFLPRPCDDLCDNPCDDLFMCCFEPYKLKRVETKQPNSQALGTGFYSVVRPLPQNCIDLVLTCTVLVLTWYCVHEKLSQFLLGGFHWTMCVQTNVYLSIDLSISLSIYNHIHTCIYLSISISLYLYLSIYLYCLSQIINHHAGSALHICAWRNQHNK